MPAASRRLGRYNLLEPLAQGGMGAIHLAASGGLGEFHKLLVIKELRPDLSRSPGFVDMFLAEAKLAARLNHPNIVQTLEAGQDGQRYFIAMEFLDGQPLHQLLRRMKDGPPIPLALRLLILCEVLSGLHYAHELRDYNDTPLQIVHRDVSPPNVFLTYHGQVKIVDFGIAKAVDSEHRTEAGVFKGKFSYAAPEQVSGRRVDRRCDVFAVGVILWELLAERRFATGLPTKAALEARLNGSERRILAVAPDTDPALAAICDRALHVDVEQRYPSAEAFRADLEQYLATHGERPQPAQLGALIRERFAVERETSHRLIQTRMHDKALRDDHVHSGVRALTANPTRSARPSFPDDSGLGDPADPLRAYANGVSNTSAAAMTTAARRYGRKKASQRLWRALLGVAATATFVAVYLWVRAELTPSDRKVAQLHASPPPVAVAPAPMLAPTHEPEPLAAPTVRDPQNAQRAKPPASIKARSFGSTQKTARLRAAAAPTAPPSAAGETSHDNDTHAAPHRTQAPEALAQPTGAQPQLGDDLRFRRNERKARPIEVEDPFR
ncbi:MAG: hypothetical protein RL701_6394 [Pseudomonadota bacterium]